MTGAKGRLTVRALLIASAILLASAILTIGRVEAAGPNQSAGEQVDIDDKECTFLLDVDGDGGHETRIDTGPGTYAHQETSLEGSCEFSLNTDAAATLVLETELVGWHAVVEWAAEPDLPDDEILRVGDNTVPGLEGGMRVTVQIFGETPRSVKSRTLEDDYRHDVQVPRPFRLMEVIVTTPAGRYDRLEETTSSASLAYINAHERVSDVKSGGKDGTSESVLGLASELLEEGYPQITERLLDAGESTEQNSGFNGWMWVSFGMIVALAIGVAIGIFVVWRNWRRSATAPLVPQSPAARGNM